MNHKALAGIGVLLFTFLGIIHYSMIDMRILVPDDVTEVYQYIRNNEWIFRIGIVLDLILFTVGIGAFAAIHLILKSQFPYLSLLSFSLILVEMGITIGVEITSFQLLEIINLGLDDQSIIETLSAELRWRAHGYLIVTFLFSISMIFISWMLKRNSIVPNWLGWIGIVAFCGLALSIVMNIMMPGNIIKWLGSIASMIGMLFQIFLGLYLIMKSRR